MISVDEAMNRILARIHVLGLEKVDIISSLGRVLGEDIVAPRDIPPIDNSAMDGYAIRSVDIKGASRESPVFLKVIEELPAGALPQRSITKGEAVRIMTGAPIPTGADTVVMVEDTERAGERVSVFQGVPPGENIRRAGEDVKKGDRVISKGSLIHPAEVGMLASVGRAFVYVHQRPVVAILCTGDELVDVDEEIADHKIVSSNSYTLSAQVMECGGLPLQLGIAKDDPHEIEQRLRQGLRADVILSSAGVSVGDYDLVKDVLAGIGFQMEFWRVAMRPGQPLAFGTIGGKPTFGLPGNPVSSMISFEEFVRPSLLKMMGYKNLFRPVVEAVLKEEIRKKSGRRYFMRARVSLEGDRYVVTTTGPQGSGILSSMVEANGLLIVPEERTEIKAGERIRVQIVDRSFESAGMRNPFGVENP
ncbi:MAG: molybdopterin molybdotransferase MoeA [Syntrophobacterales bacterium]|nr:MAG: molybdopterin molybdotransferase MoeA [Syntrophobacterales bacterium]